MKITKIISRVLGSSKKTAHPRGDRLIRIISEMVEVRQDIQELARKTEERTRKLDILIDDLLEFLKHKRIIETRRVR